MHRIEFDLVVCGGGLSGLCGAILAARQGLRVALVQDRPVLGGNASSEVRIHTHGAGTYWPWAVETGVLAEMIDEERFRNPEPVFEGSVNAICDLVFYDWAIREKMLTLFMNASVRAVKLAASLPRQIAAVHCSQLGSEKEFELAAPLFIDATGDGTVAALAGADWRMGREARGEFNEPKAPPIADRVTQGSTIQFRARDLGRAAPFIPFDWAERYPDEASVYSRGHDNPLGGYWWIEIGSPFDTLADNEAIRHELIRHVLGVFDHLKNRGEHGAGNLTLDWIGQIPGKRETRRVVGATIITENDLRQRRQWPDRVCHGGWFLDEHVPGGLLARGRKPEESAYDFDIKDRQQVGPYSIPLSALRCRDVVNLFVAGRCLSASHIALMSTRVQGTCAATGESAGAAAAVCHRRGRRPDQMSADDVAAVQQLLLKEDHYVPFVSNDDSADLARTATVAATSEAELDLDPGPGRLAGAAGRGDAAEWVELAAAMMQIVPLTAGRLDAVELLLDNRTGGDALLCVSLHRLEDIWSINRAAPADDGVGTVLRPAIAPREMEKTAVVMFRETARPGAGWVRFTLAGAVALEPGAYAVVVVGEGCAGLPGLFWARLPKRGPVASPPPGTAVAAFRRSGLWRFEGLRGNWPAQAIRLSPPSRPFAAANIINGIVRPEVMPNLWMSAPGRPMPQSLILAWPTPIRISEVRLTFDNNLGRNIRGTPGNFVAPELVRDYRVEVRTGGRWNLVVEVAGNRRRHVVHRIEPVEGDALRLVVLATNGAAEARVYEVRVYQVAAV